jgi:hypothetical protein
MVTGARSSRLISSRPRSIFSPEYPNNADMHLVSVTTLVLTLSACCPARRTRSSSSTRTSVCLIACPLVSLLIRLRCQLDWAWRQRFRIHLQYIKFRVTGKGDRATSLDFVLRVG